MKINTLLFAIGLVPTGCITSQAQEEKDPVQYDEAATSFQKIKLSWMKQDVAKNSLESLWKLRSLRDRLTDGPFFSGSALPDIYANSEITVNTLAYIAVQNTRLIDQNDKIIALLSAIAAKK